MDLILCHTTADFDTLGAAVGLTRLQPGARIVLAGGAHPAVRDFLALHRDEYALIERRSVNAKQIRSLAVVDTQRRDRLGKTAEWIDLPNIELVVYDHHPDAAADIPATRSQVELVGATTTLIVEQLQAQQLFPTPVEATVMALGIHVDTGSLTFDHATARDARALAWLMEQGASLRAIGEYVDPGLSPVLQPLLTAALEAMQTEVVQGYTIAWVLLKLEGFVPGLSTLASRLMDVTEIDALLLAAQYCRGGLCHNAPEASADYTLTVIGRSHIEGTDLNALFKPLGGGGHPRAAAVNCHPVNAPETLVQLVAQLKAQIPHPLVARELMSSPVRTIRPETTIDEAQRILLRYGHSGLSVVNTTGQLVGIISRRDLDIALHHGFSHSPVKGYMATNLKTITPETPLPAIETLMVTYDVGRLPVLEQGQLVGIVTRTDVLRQLHQAENRKREVQGRPLEVEDSSLSPSASSSPTLRSPPIFEERTQRTSLLAILYQCLLPELSQVLKTAAQAAEQRGWHLYLVGGAVRDLLLAMAGTAIAPKHQLLLEDIDLVVDGFHRAAEAEAGVELARSLQALYPASRLEIHGKFQTAALLWHNDPVLKSLWIDIATARTEFYPYPAANPEVEASSIQQDLYRRDFTINALALRLTAPRAGEVLDFFGGLLDLQAKQIRVLHANSMIEDPTRIYRAVRFAVRLGFQIDEQTESYIRHAIASGIYIQVQNNRAIAPALQTRLRAELKYILQSPYWKPALHQLADLGALQCIHPTLALDRASWHQLRLTERWLQWFARHLTPPSLTTPPSHPPTLPLSPTPSPTLPHSPPWLTLLEVLLAQLPPEHRSSVASKLQLPADSIDRLQTLEAAERELTASLPQAERPSAIVVRLNEYDPALLVLIAVRSGYQAQSGRSSVIIRQYIWRYLTEWSSVRAFLDGNDLKALGYKPGSQFKQILQALTAATLDGEVGDRAASEEFLRKHFSLT